MGDLDIKEIEEQDKEQGDIITDEQDFIQNEGEESKWAVNL